MPYFTAQQIRDGVGTQALDVLQLVAGIPRESCDGQHHPCPLCGGRDRFRVINQETGTCYCNQCFNERNGDYITAVMHFRKVKFPAALSLIADFLGLTEANPQPQQRTPQPAPVKQGPKSKYEFATTFTPFYGPSGEITTMRQSCFAVGRNPWGLEFSWNGYTYKPTTPVQSKSKVLKHTLYEYTDGMGEPHHLVHRMDMRDGKKIPALYHWNGSCYVSGKGDLPPVPYNAPEVIEAEKVFVVEGEKCAAALQWDLSQSVTDGELPPAVTCFLDGAGGWRDEYTSWFAGKEIYIYPDNDDPGRKYARMLVEALRGTARAIHVFRWPDGTPEKWDIADEILKKREVSQGVTGCNGVADDVTTHPVTASDDSARPPPILISR